MLVLAACGQPTPSASPTSGPSRGELDRRDSPPAAEPAAPVAQPGASDPPPAVDAPPGVEVGQRPPAFTISGLDGRQYSDADLRAQGKPYILYFYATW